MGRAVVRRWLAVATLAATVASSGSLYFSLGLGLIPCHLCWYQRILMYPLTIILGIGALEDRGRVIWTAFPFVIAGLAVAAYHSWLQATTATCSFSGACAVVQYRLLGLTIPNMSLLAFLLLSILFVVLWYRETGTDFKI